MADLGRAVDPIAYAWAAVNPALPLPPDLIEGEPPGGDPAAEALPDRRSPSLPDHGFWTPEKDTLVRAAYLEARAANRLPQLAERLNCARSALDRHAVVLGLISPLAPLRRVMLVQPAAPAALPVRITAPAVACRPATPRRTSSARDARIRRDYAAYRGRLRVLADELGMSLRALYTRASHLGIAAQANAVNRVKFQARNERIRAEYASLDAQGRSRLAADLGISLELLRVTAHTLGVTRSASV